MVDTDSFRLSIAVDSSDVLYQISYAAKSPSYEQVGPSLAAIAQGKKSSQVLSLSRQDFSLEGLAIERVLYSLKVLVKRYQGSDIYSEETTGVNVAELVCRCRFMDKRSLEAAFNETKGDFDKALLATNASMICSSCSQDVQAVYDGMHFEELEKKFARVAKQVQEALEDFAFVSPAQYSLLSFEVAGVKKGVVKIKAVGDRQGLGRSQIKKVLENFLTKDALEDLEISIFF